MLKDGSIGSHNDMRSNHYSQHLNLDHTKYFCILIAL
jgi:hypothetical protein